MGVDNFLGLGGGGKGANKEEMQLQFGSRGRVWVLHELQKQKKISTSKRCKRAN